VANVNEMLTQFRTQLMADKKKSAILGVLFIVLLFVVAGLFGKKPDPALAAADDLIPPAQAVTPTPAPPTLETIAPKAQEATSPAEQEADQKIADWLLGGSGSTTVCIAEMPRTPPRNLFKAPAWSKFPLVILENSADQRASNEDSVARSFWSKLGGGIVSYRAFRRQETEDIDKEFAELVLHSTMTGPKGLAHISGRLVHVGDKIRGFSVVRIEDRQVTLDKGGIQRVLSMP
jgi:hypothetical protein